MTEYPETEALAESLPPIQWDTYPGNDASIGVKTGANSSRCLVSADSGIIEIPGSSGSIVTTLNLIPFSAVPSELTNEVDKRLGPTNNGSSETVFKEDNELATENRNCRMSGDYASKLSIDAAGEEISSILQNEQESSNAFAYLNSSPNVLDDINTTPEHNRRKSTGAGVVNPDDDASQELWMHSQLPTVETELSESAAVGALHDDASRLAIFCDLSNQNIDKNQIDRQNLPHTASSDLTNSYIENVIQEFFKVDVFCACSSSRNPDSYNSLESSAVAKDSPNSVSTKSCASEVKAKKPHHLVVGGLSPKSPSNLRNSNHSNSGATVKHSESHNRCKGVELFSSEESNGSHRLSSADTDRQRDWLSPPIDDADLYITDLKNFKEIEVGERSSHHTVVKTSASHIGDAKVHRSSSYRIATTRHQRASNDDGHASEETLSVSVADDDSNSSFPSHISTCQRPDSSSKSDHISCSPHSDKAASSKAPNESTEPDHGNDLTRKGKRDDCSSSHHHSGHRQSLTKDPPISSNATSTAQLSNDPSAFPVSSATDLVATPSKTSGIRRLKELFTERNSPKDGTSAEPQHFTYDYQHISANQATFEGQLHAKNTILDGKRSIERAWRSVHAVLRDHHLYLHPDKTTPNVPAYEHPISVRSAFVDIACDHIKRKNVFRLTTFSKSEYLFEAEDQKNMLKWIKCIQECGYSHNDKEFLTRELAKQKRFVSQRTSRSSHRKHSDSQRSPPLSSKIPEPVDVAQVVRSSGDFSDSLQTDSHFTDEEVAPPKVGGTTLRPSDNSEQKSKDQTWKSKMVKKFKRLSSQSPSTPNAEQTGAFGVELDKCVPSANNEFVPLIVDSCIKIVESKGLTNRGIYRVPGNSASISQLQTELNKDPASINFESEKWQDVNAVISLLKLFFRELPLPLMTKELYSSLIEANRIDDSAKRLLKIKCLIHHLPMHNFETLHFLACHLSKVASVGDINMMDARNLAIIFGPTLLQPKQDIVNMVKDMSDQCRIVESIIQHCDWLFSSLDEDVNVLANGEKDLSTNPVTGMDQQLLEKAEHMVLEEQVMTSRWLWRPNFARKANTNNHCTSASGDPSESHKERNIDAEISLKNGLTGNKRNISRNYGKSTKIRAKSVPPRPVSTLNIPGGRLVERMTETAPAKRKNSSPVSLVRRELSNAGGAKTVARRQFHRSNSAANDRYNRLSSSVKGRQPVNTKHPALEQCRSRHRQSVSSHFQYNSKFAPSQKPASGSTLCSSQEILGNPQSTRTSQICEPRSALASNVGDVTHRKGVHHQAKSEGIGKVSHPKSSATEPKKMENLTGKVELAAEIETDVIVGTKINKNQKSETSMKTSKYEMNVPDSSIQGQQDTTHDTREVLVPLKQADSRKIWNAAHNTWECISANKDISTAKSSTKYAVNNDLSAMSTVLKDKNLSVVQNYSDCLNVFTEKLNLNLEVSGQHTGSFEITEQSIGQPVVCKEKENHVDVVVSDNVENSLVRNSPISKSVIKSKVHEVAIANEVTDGTAAKVSPSHDFNTSNNMLQNPFQTVNLVVNQVLEDSQNPQQCNYSVLSEDNQMNNLKAQQQEFLRNTLDGDSPDRNLEPTLKSISDSDELVLKRTSSEPSMVLLPVIAHSLIRTSPRKDTTRPKHRRSNSASTRCQSYRVTSDHSNNTQPGRTRRRRGNSPYEGSRSLTYESSV